MQVLSSFRLTRPRYQIEAFQKENSTNATGPLRINRIEKLTEIYLIKISVEILEKKVTKDKQINVLNEMKKLLFILEDQDKKMQKNEEKNEKPKEQQVQIQKPQSQNNVNNDMGNGNNSFANFGIRQKRQINQLKQSNENLKSQQQNGLLADCEIFLSDFKKFHFSPQFQIRQDNKMVFKVDDHLFGFSIGYLTLLLITDQFNKLKQLKSYIINYDFTHQIATNQQIQSITQDNRQLIALLLKVINILIQTKDVWQVLNEYDIKPLILLIFTIITQTKDVSRLVFPDYFESLAQSFNMKYIKDQNQHQFKLNEDCQMIIQQNTQQILIYLV